MAHGDSSDDDGLLVSRRETLRAWAAAAAVGVAGATLPALITNLGHPIHEIFLFDDLAESCEQDGVYTMLYVGAPLKITGGDGAPINPTVVKAGVPEQAEDRPGGGDDGDDDEDDDGRPGRGRDPSSPGGPDRDGNGDGDRPW